MPYGLNFLSCVSPKNSFLHPFLKFKSFLFLIAIPIVTVLGIVYSDYIPLFIYAISSRRTLRKILIFLKFHCQINISMHMEGKVVARTCSWNQKQAIFSWLLCSAEIAVVARFRAFSISIEFAIVRLRKSGCELNWHFK